MPAIIISNNSYGPALSHGFKHPTHVVDSLDMLAKGRWVVRAGPGWPPV